MKAIVSVFAKDSKGITAYVTSLLAQQEINILDISQTLMQEYFAMIMLVDLADCTLPFNELAELLKAKVSDQQQRDPADHRNDRSAAPGRADGHYGYQPSGLRRPGHYGLL